MLVCGWMGGSGCQTYVADLYHADPALGLGEFVAGVYLEVLGANGEI